MWHNFRRLLAMWIIHSFPLLQGPRWPAVIVLVWVPCIFLIVCQSDTIGQCKKKISKEATTEKDKHNFFCTAQMCVKRRKIIDRQFNKSISISFIQITTLAENKTKKKIVTIRTLPAKILLKSLLAEICQSTVLRLTSHGI